MPSADDKLIYGDLSYTIMGAVFEVGNTLGGTYQEKYYQRALAEEFSKRKIQFKEQVPIQINYKDVKLGRYFLDFVVEEKVIVEIKKGMYFSPSNIEQVYNYLKSTDLKLGLLINFTPNGVRYKRVLNVI